MFTMIKIIQVLFYCSLIPYTANCLRWKCFAVVKLNCKFTVKHCGCMVVLCGQILLHGSSLFTGNVSWLLIDVQKLKLFHLKWFAIYGIFMPLSQKNFNMNNYKMLSAGPWTMKNWMVTSMVTCSVSCNCGESCGKSTKAKCNCY